MAEDKIYLVPNVTGPTECVTIDPKICVGCNACADICRVQAIMPNPVPGKPPIVAYPDECWYCSCCLEVCRTGALHMNFPINQRILFKRKETGEIFRLGEDGIEKTYFHTPYGDMTRDMPGTAVEYEEPEEVPVSDAEAKAAELDEVIEKYKDVPGSLITVMQEAQRIYGWLSPETKETIADGMGVQLSELAGVESFYTFFNNVPRGETVIRVCTAAPCHVNGADDTVKALEAELGIKVGETTPDGKFSLLGCDCLGVCDRSPAILVGDKVYGPVSAADVPAFVASLKEGGCEA